MSRIGYESWAPAPAAQAVIRLAEEICADYQAQGYDLTLRQLYYQFVARGHIRNSDAEYKRLGSIINKARMAGLLDWDYIIDRTRNVQTLGHWTTPAHILGAAAASYQLDRWKNQPTRVEVWVEKEALAGVIGLVADRHDVSYFSCRGYVSQSKQWGAAQRLRKYIEAGQNVVVLHLGDHDPSGIDMTRDITDRITRFIYTDIYQARHRLGVALEDNTFRGIRAFIEEHYTDGRLPLEIDRIALNFDQVQQYSPPPNPAKMTDSRADKYVERFGDESWELDALDPATLDALIEDHILELRDDDLWADMEEQEGADKSALERVTGRWSEVAEWLETHKEEPKHDPA